MLSAQEEGDTLDIFDLSLSDLQNVEISSSSRAYTEKLKDANATVILITEQQIQERGYLSLLDCLTDLPAFKIDRGVDPRWLHDITLRGIRYMDKFIILLNGVRISSPTNEIIPIIENYPVHWAKQIEVIYGPVSSLYGADAFSGVINIITKDPGSDYNMSGYLEAGLYNSYLANFQISREFSNGLSFLAGGQYHFDMQPDLADFYPEIFQGRDEQLESGVFNTINGSETAVAPVDEEARFPISAHGFFTSFGYKGLKFNYFTNRARVPSSTANTPSNSVYNRDQFFAHNLHMAGLQYRFDAGEWSFRTQLTYSQYRLDNESNFRNIFTGMEPAYLFARGNMLKADQLFSRSLDRNDALTLSGGITMEWFSSIPRSNNLEFPVKAGELEKAILAGSVSDTDPQGIPASLIDINYRNTGGFLQFDYRPSESWKFTLGTRVDSDTRFDVNVNPRIAAIYAPVDKFQINLQYGTAFLAPSPQNTYDRYGLISASPRGQYSASFYNLPNPELRPQEIGTYELNFNLKLGENLSILISNHFSKVSNLISPVSSSEYPNLVGKRYPDNEFRLAGRTITIDSIQINENIGVSYNYGTMLFLQYRNSFASGLRIDGAFSYAYIAGGIDVDEAGPRITRELPGVSPHQLKLALTAEYDDLTISIRSQWVNEQRAFNVNSVIDSDDDGSLIDETQYFSIDGYLLLQGNLVYRVSPSLSLRIRSENILDQRYRNINIGARPDSANSLGSATIEFAEGAPQKPFRIFGGVNFSF